MGFAFLSRRYCGACPEKAFGDRAPACRGSSNQRERQERRSGREEGKESLFSIVVIGSSGNYFPFLL